MKATTEKGFKELSCDEMFEVNGGWVGIALSAICAAFGAAAWLGDQHGRQQAYKDRYGR